MAIITSNTGGLTQQALTTSKIIVFITSHTSLSCVTASISYAAALAEGIAEIADSASILHLALAGSRNQRIAPTILQQAIV